MQIIDAIFYIAILIMSVVIHEVSHGYVAELYGDKTARHAGRLTLNPIVHLDLWGSLIIPALLYFSTGFAFGWAKPVPYNPDNLSDRKWGSIAVAAAGVCANLFIAVFFGLILRFTYALDMPTGYDFMLYSIVIINLALAIFNLVPIPPLDGSKILFPLLPQSFSRAIDSIEQYSIIFLLIFIFFFSEFLSPILGFLFKLITGLSL
ncbi:MAG: Peptidase M50 [Candidatus Nomurabacteria bacterium GW2011_GWA2_40_9]|uniref:Peptidase M50 n=1 Tax=Candidatus Nomurabacteria bacterium GW2011_GWA2_40_9 TaxID=1618734 RepID=A0A0G0WW66_9BACT|nr:MAG: Peptidase M50 [Candidatus Nomurabacteria bacterium GW2011_GWA2_40_9]